jgi:DNA-directed DNA polymerase III PolC
MGENTTVSHLSPNRHVNSELYLKSAAQMEKLFTDYPQALLNTVLVNERCNVTLPLGQYHFPYFDVPAGKDAFTYLRELCYRGLYSIYTAEHPVERLEYELGVIRDLGFTEYFLVVWDIVSFAKREGIRCAGRGSAADSLVAYVLGLTCVDPVANDLLFERFLNPERKGMPDIDMDFDSARRDEVLSYVYNRYESDKVAMVGTVNTFTARSALREVSKALGFKKAETDRLAAFMPRISAGSISQAIERLPELKDFPRGKKYEQILRICADIDGAPRHLSVHLGGVVISRDPLTDLVPLQWSAKGVIVTQYDKDDLEALGLVKMDLLGLRILSAIQETVDRVRAEGVDLDIDSIPLDDNATYGLLRTTNTVGVFQLESPGMRELLGRLQPSRFSDVIANIALFRPGPMQADMISPFIARRHGEEEVKFAHPCLIAPLAETYGVIIYQEQVLQVAAAMGGFSLGQADILRRAMTKDCSAEEMTSLREAFLRGASEQGIDSDTADEVFRQLSAFAAYGFNKAHAATFGLISYQTAFLKAHYPAEFLCSILNHQPMGYYPGRTILHDARISGINILPLDLRYSEYDFSVEDRAIRIGFKAIPSFNRDYYLKLHLARQSPFLSFDDALTRLHLPHSLWAKLLDAGALDFFAGRLFLKATLAHFFSLPRSVEQEQFTFFSYEMEQPIEEMSLREKLLGEFSSTGFCYTAHPMQLFARELKSLQVTSSRALAECNNGERVRVAGLVVSRQTPPTRSTQRVIFMTIEDCTGLVDIAVFSRTQEKYAQQALGASVVLVEGVLRKTGARGISITADRVLDMKEIAERRKTEGNRRTERRHR